MNFLYHGVTGWGILTVTVCNPRFASNISTGFATMNAPLYKLLPYKTVGSWIGFHSSRLPQMTQTVQEHG